ncbi:transposase [Nostoc carneum NIES-2107]|nr:transposase [Nostoc carneum NIES-2107]
MIHVGRAHVRATLYMGAVAAMRHNPVIKAFFHALFCQHAKLATGEDSAARRIGWCGLQPS